MPLPVIAGVRRITLNWSREDGVQPVNVFHVGVSGSPPNEEQVGEDIVASMQDDMFGSVCPSFHFDTITVLPLDGTSAGIEVAAGGAGQGTGSAGACVPAEALVLSLRTATRGPSGRGRLFLGPCSEPDVSSGLYDGATTRTDIIAAWTAFATALDGVSYGMGLVVASYVHSTAQGVTSFTASEVLGTQRRRQDQLR